MDYRSSGGTSASFIWHAGQYYSIPRIIGNIGWPGRIDSALVGTYSLVDMKHTLDEWGSVYGPLTGHSRVVFLVRDANELVRLASLQSQGRVSSLKWSTGLGPFPVLLVNASYSTRGVRPYHYEHSELWRLVGDSLAWIGRLDTESDEVLGWLDVRGLRGELSVEDIDAESPQELLYRRSWGFGTHRQTHCSDPGIIAFRVDENELSPIWLVSEGNAMTRIRPGMPVLMFPQWDDQNPPPISDEDSSLSRLIDDAVSDISKVTLSDTVPWPPIATVVGSFLGETVELEVWSDSCTTVAIWLDTELESDFDDSTWSGDEWLVTVTPTVPPDSVIVTKFRFGRDAGLEQITAHRIGCTKFRTGVSVTVPLQLSEMQPNNERRNALVFGFAVESLNAPEDIQGGIVSRVCFPRGMNRYDPRTWGNLMLGVRRDTVYVSDK